MKKVSTLFVIIPLLLIALLSGCASNNNSKAPKAIKGVLDLSSWDINAHAVQLSGEWEFYRGKLVKGRQSSDSSNATVFANVPHRWDKKPPYDSVATYLLRVKLGHPYQTLALEIRQAISVYRIFVDTQLVLQEGNIASDKHSFRGVCKPGAAFFHVQGNEFIIAVQVQTYYHLKSENYASAGFWPYVKVSSTAECVHQRLLAFGIAIFLLGCVVILAIYQLVFLLYFRREGIYLYLCILCTAVAAFVVGGMPECVIAIVFPSVSPGLYFRLWSIGQFSVAMFLVISVGVIFPRETNRKLVLMLLVPYALLSCIVLIRLEAFFEYDFLDIGWQIHLVLCLLYANIIVFLAVRHKREGAIPMMIGVGLCFIFGVLDGLTSAQGAFPMVMYCVCVFFVGQSFLLAKMFSKAQHEVLRQQTTLLQAEKLITLGTVVAEVAHEVNNPSHSLFLDAQTNEKTWASVMPILNERAEESGDFKIGVFPYSKFKQEIASLSDRMKRNCERIKRIVEDLRSFAKKDIDLNEDVNINTIIRSSLSVVQHVTGKCTGNLRLQLNDSIPCVKGSVRHLEQVVINLVKNACQSLASVDKAVSISTSCIENNIIITVSDEGRGMDEEMVKNVFTPFYTTKGKEGTGLGLSICNNIIKNHGGRIEVKSVVGIGTAVTVILPVSKT
jgi:signal transduction histidine kinase